MVPRFRHVAAAVAAAGLGLVPGLSRGQAGAGAPNAAMYANPYANPYVNPFLNPYMTQMPAQGNPAVYLFAAQQYNGGIGSGQLSGTRPRPGAPATPPPSGLQNRRASDIPGGSAATFFNRAPRPAVTSGRHYNRQARYYPVNGQ